MEIGSFDVYIFNFLVNKIEIFSRRVVIWSSTGYVAFKYLDRSICKQEVHVGASANVSEYQTFPRTKKRRFHQYGLVDIISLYYNLQ